MSDKLFCSNCGVRAVLCEVPPIMDRGLSQEDGLSFNKSRLEDVFGTDWKSKLEILGCDPLYNTYQVRYRRPEPTQLKYPPSTHQYTTNDTYYGPGCAMCGQIEGLHPKRPQ